MTESIVDLVIVCHDKTTNFFNEFRLYLETSQQINQNKVVTQLWDTLYYIIVDIIFLYDIRNPTVDCNVSKDGLNQGVT